MRAGYVAAVILLVTTCMHHWRKMWMFPLGQCFLFCGSGRLLSDPLSFALPRHGLAPNFEDQEHSCSIQQSARLGWRFALASALGVYAVTRRPVILTSRHGCSCSCMVPNSYGAASADFRLAQQDAWPSRARWGSDSTLTPCLHHRCHVKSWPGERCDNIDDIQVAAENRQRRFTVGKTTINPTQYKHRVWFPN